jgi:hypothetical protein
MELHRFGQHYCCERIATDQFRLTNGQGDRLIVTCDDQGRLVCDDKRANQPYVSDLIAEASIGLGVLP